VQQGAVDYIGGKNGSADIGVCQSMRRDKNQ